MNFVKSKVGEKIIIILIVLLIFNIALPNQVKAWDIAGILLKPITALILANVVSLNVSLGVMLNGAASIGIALIR